MAFLIAQGGSDLFKVDLSTGAKTQLTLPSGVTLSTTRKPKFAVLNQWVVMVNSPTRNLAIDPEGTVRVLCPLPPAHPPSAAAGSGTGNTGAYQYAQSFIVTNSDGDLLMESPLSPLSPSLSLTNQNTSLSDLAISVDSISARRVYRTLAGGSDLYFLLDHDGNTGEATIEGITDTQLALLPSLTSSLVAPPGTLPGIRMKAICEWKSRLWGIADDPALLDTVFASDTNKVYSWPNSLIAYPTGQDAYGVLGFVPRKNQLGLLKRGGLWQVSASTTGTGVAFANLSVSTVQGGETGGSLSPDTIVVVGDKAYWLGNDGVYEWSDTGLKKISESVDPWFTTGTYFNRSRFPNAFAKYNKLANQYELHLAPAGSSSEDRWVAFNLDRRTWFGPHKTAAFTPSHAAHLVDANGLPIAVVGGSDGVVYVANSATYKDGSASAIDMDCYGRIHHGDAPDIEHVWAELSVQSRIQGSGTLDVTPYLGYAADSLAATTALSHDMTKGRERLARLGQGSLMRLRFRQNTVNVGAGIMGYEVPFTEVARR